MFALLVSAVPFQSAAAAPAAISEIELLTRAYLKTFPQLTRAQAEEAAAGQGKRILLRERLSAERPAGFGGSSYEPLTNTERVAVTDAETDRRVVELGSQFGVKVMTRRVKFSYRALEGVANSLNKKGVRGLGHGFRYAGVDVSSNRVVVAVEPGAMAQTKAATASLPQVRLVPPAASDAVPEVCTDRYHCGNPARSGINIWHHSDRAWCSLGFTARTSTPPVSRWIITAGHCAEGEGGGRGVQWGHGGQPFGPLQSFFNVGNVDVARIRVDSSYWVTGGYMYTETNPNTTVDVDLAIQYRASIAVGDGVCLNARRGAVCGVVTNTVDSRGMVRVDADGCPGDSGGGWYWPGGSGRWAFGIHHGGTTSCPADGAPAGGTSLFSTLPDINAYWDGEDAIGAGLRVETR
ncbi:S1 family peptidase [Phytohabitans rumicis]|uniref:S1 family peptidase n=1 Tax=Phytohabitans rumicis TaxID=1076125 RepID=UPI0015666BC1|nr:S1 family peptidase [Phytohabitans rumicis]